MKEKTHRTYLDRVLQIVEELHNELPDFLPHLESPIKTVRLELRFYKMLFWRLAYWEELEHDSRLCSTISTMMSKLSQIAVKFIVKHEHSPRRSPNINWEKMTYNLEERIQEYKPQAKKICIHLLRGTFKSKFCQDKQELFLERARDTASFIKFILQNLRTLIKSNIDMIAPVKQQIAIIQGTLTKLGRFVSSINHSITRVKISGELILRIRTMANHISCLACLYWIDGRDGSLASTTETMLSDLLNKKMPHTSGVIASYLELAIIPQLLASYLDFFLKDLVIPMEGDIEILHEGFILLLSFIVDPPEEDTEDKELIMTQIYTIIHELPSLVCSIHSEAKFSSFLQKVDSVKAKVRELYVKTLQSSQFNYPRINAIGFIDSLSGNLKKMLETKVNFIPFIKHQVEVLEKELPLFKAFLQSKIELQNEGEEIKNLWTKIMNMVYNADYVIKLCHARSFSVWYGILGLSNVMEDIKLIKTEIQKIEYQQMYKNKIFSAEVESSNALPPQATTSKIEGVFLGFEKDEGLIIGYLIRGQQYLTIISISGLPGQGKTTLAKRIYNDTKIQYHFHKIVWCYISKDYTVKELLIKIAREVGKVVKNREIEDLAEGIRKHLKGKRYLVIMDDIWDVDAWRKIEGSFPDDNNGSRILFTSRDNDLASQAKPNSISHRLPLFSDEESWELMKENIFHSNGCPLEFLEIGKQIAKYCKGLPLAVVLIAAFLEKAEKKAAFWYQVAEKLKLHLVDEGCRNIIELSYKYLSEQLKSCFIYFGAFPRGQIVPAKILKRLWIAEGFIKDNKIDMANKCLENLVSKNLVIVAQKSSMGGIKMCIVHDLLFDLCLEKAKEENFLHWKKSVDFDHCYSSPEKYNHKRLIIGTTDLFIEPKPICTRKELPTSQVQSLMWLQLGDYSRKATHEYFSHFLKSFKVLTVLDLERVDLKCHEFPKVILSNIHLRYLAFWSKNNIGIPSSIADLWNLETLIVRGFDLEDPLPASIWKMKSLRHVNVPRARLHLDDFEEENSLTTYNIETLGTLILVHDSKTEAFLRKLPRLKKLICCFKDYEFPPMLCSMFGSFQNLESLQIDRLSFLRKELPLFNFHENLLKLSLSLLRLSWSAMSAIGKQLPNLQVLKLVNSACSGTSWELRDEDFSKLRFLKLDGLDIEQIEVSCCDYPFPNLEQFVVDRCHAFKEIPSSFGSICTLNTIIVLGCFSLEVKDSAMRILEEQRDFGNHNVQVIFKHDNEGSFQYEYDDD